MVAATNGLLSPRKEQTMPEQEEHLTLGNARVKNLKKCASGNCIGVIVEVPEKNHVTNITKTGSDFVHPCDKTLNCGHKKAWIPVPGFPNQAQWLGWTDSGNPALAFVLH